jgi:hypothetical protein
MDTRWLGVFPNSRVSTTTVGTSTISVSDECAIMVPSSFRASVAPRSGAIRAPAAGDTRARTVTPGSTSPGSIGM